jgi:hypothetical protein
MYGMPMVSRTVCAMAHWLEASIAIKTAVRNFASLIFFVFCQEKRSISFYPSSYQKISHMKLMADA